MSQVFHDADANPAVVAGRYVAVLGCSSMALAHAGCLRDSGVTVVVGVLPGMKAPPAFADNGFRVLSTAQACEESDTHVLLEPDPVQRRIYDDVIAPNIVPGDALVFGSGYNVAYSSIEPPRGVDVLLVAPQADGHTVREEFRNGRGVPAVMAVTDDSSDGAWPLLLSYTRALGGLRTGGLYSTFGEYTHATLFGAHAIIDGFVMGMMAKGFSMLTAQGYDPEIAYLACAAHLRRAADRLSSAKTTTGTMYLKDTGESHGRDLSDFVARAGGEELLSAEHEGALRNVLGYIQSGRYASEFTQAPDGKVEVSDAVQDMMSAGERVSATMARHTLRMPTPDASHVVS